MPQPDWPQPHHDFSCDFGFQMKDGTFVRYFHYVGGQEFFRTIYPGTDGQVVDLLSLPFDDWINGLMIHADNLLHGYPMEVI